MMLWLSQLEELFSPLRVFQYITFRTFAAGGTAFVVSLILGPGVIRRLTKLNYGQEIRQEMGAKLLETHQSKQGTPVMGGLLILAGTVSATLLWADLSNRLVWLALGSLVVMGMLGFWDDYTKITQKSAGGIKGRTKLLIQLVWAFVLTEILWLDPVTREVSAHFMVPFIKDPVIYDMGFVGTLLFFTVVFAGCSNAVNLTDGLDGLAAGCSSASALAYMALAYVAGHAVFAEYLQVPYIPGAGELAIFCGALGGAGLGFLWFNCYPAKIFMGDTGSLAIGGAIGSVAILTKQELLLMIVGGVFMVEALSVILQVGSFKLTGKRIFRCAPIHHHFELQEKERASAAGRPAGIVETTITTRFWILSILCALIGIATLKIR